MFQFSGFAYIYDRSSNGQVSPFGNPRINSYLLIPAAYRSLSRPSSPLRAKASPVYPFLLSSTYTPFARIVCFLILVASVSCKYLVASSKTSPVLLLRICSFQSLNSPLYCCLLFQLLLPICQRTFVKI